VSSYWPPGLLVHLVRHPSHALVLVRAGWRFRANDWWRQRPLPATTRRPLLGFSNGDVRWYFAEPYSRGHGGSCAVVTLSIVCDGRWPVGRVLLLNATLNPCNW